MFLPHNFVVIDCETTGLDPQRHSLISIGAVTANGATFYCECRPDSGAEIDPEALRVNGYDATSWDHRLSAGEAVEQLLAWLGEHHVGRWIVGGKNPRFDYEFLRATLRRHGSPCELKEILCRHLIDLHTLVYASAMVQGVDLNEVGTVGCYTALGLPQEVGLHHALGGARCALEAFRALERSAPLVHA